jgi:hypothetical protein
MIHNWRSKGQIIEGDDPGDNFGYALALSADGETIAVGARERQNFPDGEKRRGYVQVLKFIQDVADWVPVGDKVYGSDERDNFGHAVSLSSDGQLLAVSTPYFGSQYARIFQVGEDELTQLGEDLGRQYRLAVGCSFWKIGGDLR